jgi:hypothetical protein
MLSNPFQTRTAGKEQTMAFRRFEKGPEMFEGQKWRASHQSTVDSILGAGVRGVRSQGDAFYNTDNWVARAFGAALCEWAELNPGRVPTRNDIAGWVVKANQMNVTKKEIVIAATPDELPKGLAHALVGGGYHEAWHTLYSRTKFLHLDEVVGPVLALWGLIAWDSTKGLQGWKGLTGALLTWSNIIEDIRIERCGCREYPGAVEKMEALQDLILMQEAEGRQAAEHRGLAGAGNSPLAVISGTFRDVGLGYTTEDQTLALDSYKTGNRPAYDFVMSGPLRPFLDQAIVLQPKDDLASLWLAMSVVAAIANTATSPPPPPPPPAPPKKGGEKQKGGGEGQPGEGKPQPGSGGGGGKKGQVWKAGERAKLKTGPYAGREVEVTLAGLPDAKGVQVLEFALVEGS